MAGENHVAADELRNYIERVERLTEERQGINEDIKDVFGEAKANGYDAKIMRKVIAERKKERHAREEERAMFETYMSALGLL